MKLMIDISKEKYQTVLDGTYCGSLYEELKNGIPLPEGHWIHRMKDGGCFWEECSVCHTERAFPTKYCPDCGTYMYADIRTDAQTVIEADKAESEGKE